MNEKLHRHLDGELEVEGLPPSEAGEAEAWDRLVSAIRSEIPGSPAPPWMEDRVMAGILEHPEPSLVRRLLAWLLRPRPVLVSPLTAGVAIAGLATLLVLGWQEGGEPPADVDILPPTGSSLASTPASAPVVYVQFNLHAPGASSVAVAGDFDGWEGVHGLRDLDGDGVWTGRVPLSPGVHAYMFVVDESEWVTDPQAERYTEDGFGNRNAILAVAVPTT